MNGAVVTPVRQSIAFRAVSSIAPTVPEGSYRVPTEGTLLAVRLQPDPSPVQTGIRGNDEHCQTAATPPGVYG